MYHLWPWAHSLGALCFYHHYHYFLPLQAWECTYKSSDTTKALIHARETLLKTTLAACEQANSGCNWHALNWLTDYKNFNKKHMADTRNWKATAQQHRMEHRGENKVQKYAKLRERKKWANVENKLIDKKASLVRCKKETQSAKMANNTHVSLHRTSNLLAFLYQVSDWLWLIYKLWTQIQLSCCIEWAPSLAKRVYWTEHPPNDIIHSLYLFTRCIVSRRDHHFIHSADSSIADVVQRTQSN